MKTKTYILTLSRTFPKGHPREGEETNFADKARHAVFNATRARQCIYGGPLKLHTICANYELWKQRIDEVNAGRAVLSVREWLGAPRRSKQRELFRLDRDSGIGVEKFVGCDSVSPSDYDGMYATPAEMYDFSRRDVCVLEDADYEPWYIDKEEVARNDGLSLEDWKAWFGFPDDEFEKPMAIIHFTSFRYCK